MKIGKCYLVVCGVWANLALAAQEVPDIERLLENNSIEMSEDGYEEMLQTLQYLQAEPINVNRADFDLLKVLFLLSDSQIDQILAFREKNGRFLHLNELLWVPGIGQKDLENIRPFITLGETDELQRLALMRGHWHHDVLARTQVKLPEQEGYKVYSPDEFGSKKAYERKLENRFHGSPVGTLLKMSSGMGELVQIGLTMENDPGEAYFTRNQKTGFDFLSAHVRVRTPHVLRQLVLGDYRLQWGQGLVAWSGFSCGKSDVAVGNEKSGKGVVAYTSTDENNYLRGGALTLCPLRNLTAEMFFSFKKTDGNLVAADTLSEEELLNVSLYTAGYHRNNGECRKKHVLKEVTGGFALHWNSDYGKIGLHALYYDFTPSLIPRKQLYRKYDDTGDRRWLAGIDYKTAWRGIYLFGETAVSDQGAVSTVNGLRMSNSSASACLLYRRYDKRYTSRYAAGFGEYSNTSNEEGIYLGMELTPLKDLKIDFYYDWFHFFSARYLAARPGSGWEGLAEATFRHGKFEHAWRYKREERPEDKKGEGSVRRGKSEYRYQCNYKVTSLLELHTRLSVSQYRKGEVREAGYMIFQDVVWTNSRSNFKLQGRLAYFHTDSYQSRIYAYENNVLYGYSFPSFMGRGWRTYLNLNWKPLNWMTCYLKTGFVVYPGRETISSGVTQVDGNKLCDLTFQLRFRF